MGCTVGLAEGRNQSTKRERAAAQRVHDRITWSANAIITLSIAKLLSLELNVSQLKAEYEHKSTKSACLCHFGVPTRCRKYPVYQPQVTKDTKSKTVI